MESNGLNSQMDLISKIRRLRAFLFIKTTYNLIMEYKDFDYFIIERESIRKKKEAGLPRPWTDDYILDKCHFANVDREYDKASKILFDYIKDMNDFERIFYIILYRSYYSSPKVLTEMTGLWIHDIRNIQCIKLKLWNGQGRIKTSFYKGIKPTSFVHLTLWNIAYDLNDVFSSFDNISILDATDILSALYTKYYGNRTLFLSSEIIKDLCYFYPKRINPDSECHYSPSSRRVLKKYPGFKVEIFSKNTELNYSQLDHSIAQSYRWWKRREYYLKYKTLRKSWLY